MAAAAEGADHLHAGLSAAEVEFLAEDTAITITPTFEAEELHFIAGSVGPFRPMRPVDVPLWLALTLRSRGKCTIHPPEWMNLDLLKEKLEQEKALGGAFAEMPQHYLEISSLLFEAAEGDIRDCEQVRQVLRDIQDVRYSKVRQGLNLIKESAAVKLNNITLMEINAVRPFFAQSMDVFFKLTSA